MEYLPLVNVMEPGMRFLETIFYVGLGVVALLVIGAYTAGKNSNK